MKSKLNKTIMVGDAIEYKPKTITQIIEIDQITDAIFNNDLLNCINNLPTDFADLMIIDPPYNLTKNYGNKTFKQMTNLDYVEWFTSVMIKLKPLLKATSTLYVCSDWKSSTLIYPVLNELFKVQNRITWEREKGRGCSSNFKNNIEDIWFCTNSNNYYFNVDAVKLKKNVIAPYKENDKPKDWVDSKDGKFRMTCPSNVWTDLVIPFWSMAENTEHPTQKPEKLIAKLLMASSKENDFVFDPFAGSGTSLVVSKKLNRRFCGIELDEGYCKIAMKRLESAESDKRIQGYENGLFLDRGMK